LRTRKLEPALAACTFLDRRKIGSDCLLQSAVATHCPQQFDAKAFFEDTPWLDIPPSRRAHIVCEVLPQPRGLLGGSAKSEKMSKLAALAAKRRQKENARPVQAEESGPTAANDYASSLKALRLSSAPPVERKVSEKQSEVDTAATQKLAANDLETHPTKHLKIDKLDPSKPEFQFKPEDVIAQPSAFAKTMFGAAPQARPLNLVLPIHEPLHGDYSPAFDFTTPSPDDLVTRAQAAKGPR
jgi:elongation factor 1 alpha-like protein